MTQTVKEVLVSARALIDTPEKWIKALYEHEGCYCASGAVRKAARGNALGDWSPANDALVSALPSSEARTVPDFNDHPDTTHADIMALFDRAIAACDEG